MMARLAAVALLLAAGCGREAPVEKAPATEKAATAEKATTAEKAAPEKTAPATTPVEKTPAPPATTTQGPAPLPGSDRVFVVPDGEGHLLLGADADRLWAVRPAAPGAGTEIWRIQGPGVVHEITHGDLGDGPRIFAAWGVGRGFLQAPLVIEAIDPQTGKRSEIWRRQGERNQVAGMQVADADRDGKPELALAHYASKYMVEPVKLLPGQAPVPGAQIRMASSWLHADLDGEAGPEAIIGRVYGDARGLPGDLRIRTAKGEVAVPTDRGVKALMYGAPGGEPAALYFVDGWEADYGKKATARLNRVRLVEGKPQVEVIGTSAEDFTFFALTEVDLNGDGVTEIAAQGNARVSLFERVDGTWTQRPLADLEPILNTAIGRGPGGWTLYVPAKPVTRAVRLTPR